MSWIKTTEAGIYRHDTIPGKWKVIATAQDPVTKKMIYRRKTLDGSMMLDALAWRDEAKVRMIQAGAPGADIIAPNSISYFAVDWAAEMIVCGRWKPSTAATNEQILKEHILPRIGHLRVDQLSRADIRKWVEDMESMTYDRAQSPNRVEMVRYAHKSLRRYWRVLRHLINAIYLEGHVDRRLVEWCREVRGPMAHDIEPRRERKTLTLDELRALVAAAKVEAPTRYAEIVMLAWTGMRAGELYGLEWQHIDYGRRQVRVEQSYSKGVLGPVKTGKCRTVPIIPEIIDALQVHRQNLIRQQNIGLADDIVFPSDIGTRRDASSLHKPLSKAARAALIDVKVGGQVLRRTLVTLLKNTGAQVSLIMAIAGHERIETNDGYTAPRTEDMAAPITNLYGR